MRHSARKHCPRYIHLPWTAKRLKISHQSYNKVAKTQRFSQSSENFVEKRDGFGALGELIVERGEFRETIRHVGADHRVGPSSLPQQILRELRVEGWENLVLLLGHALRGATMGCAYIRGYSLRSNARGYWAKIPSASCRPHGLTTVSKNYSITLIKPSKILENSKLDFKV
jgi:hypothetical protein